jgi:hypothetical protein
MVVPVNHPQPSISFLFKATTHIGLDYQVLCRNKRISGSKFLSLLPARLHTPMQHCSYQSRKEVQLPETSIHWRNTRG